MADNRELDLSTLSTQQLDGLKKSLEKVRAAAAERRGERRVACGAARAGAPGASRLRRSAPYLLRASPSSATRRMSRR